MRDPLVRRVRVAAAAAAAIAAVPGSPRAGGLSRPNIISARGVGMGGAFVAVADDPTALHFNPAGIALIPGSVVLAGAEYVYAPRTYTPMSAQCDADPEFAACQPQSATVQQPVPVVGWVSRLDDDGVPSRLAFGVGAWATFGGRVEYDRFVDDQGRPLDDIPAINRSSNFTIEVVPGVAYEVNDVLALGFAFRLGIGVFDADTTARPSDAVLSASGIGVAATAGAMVKLSRSFRIGVAYRTPLTNKLTGDGTVDTGREIAVDVKVDQQWPQQASAGLLWQVAPRLRLVAQVDWTDWSRLNTLEIGFPNQASLNQTFVLDWNDNYAVHAGAEWDASDAVAVRAGATYDSIAVPDHTIERQFVDNEKLLVAAGATFRAGARWRIDAAFEALIPTVDRIVEDNCDPMCGFTYPVNTAPPNRANPAPGKHDGKLYTVELAARFLY